MPRRRKPARKEDVSQTPGFAWRVSLSIVAVCGLVVFFILWLFFFANSFTVYQNLAVALAALLIFFAIMGASWSSWELNMERSTATEKSDFS